MTMRYFVTSRLLLALALTISSSEAFTASRLPLNHHSTSSPISTLLFPAPTSPLRTQRPAAACSSATQLHLVPFDSSAVSLLVSAAADSQSTTSPEPIHSAFTVATFLPQPFWLLMILAPKAKMTKKIMGGLGVCLCVCMLLCDLCLCVRENKTNNLVWTLAA